MKQIGILLLLTLTSLAFAQVTKSQSRTVAKPVDKAPTSQVEIPVRTLEFKVVESDPSLSISPLTTLPAQCTSDGSLFLDMRDPKDPRQSTVISIRGKKSQTYSPSSITDLHEPQVSSFFPSDDIVGLLVGGTKESRGAPGPGKSPTGVTWKDYHNYIAEFDRNGSYQRAIELPMTYSLSHLAILPSGEFLVAGYDELNSTLRLVLLDSSGQVVTTLDLPASRKSGGNAPYDSVKTMMASANLIGSIAFTAYDKDILVWRRGSSDPILDVGLGGRVREVALHVPPGSVFVDMIAANDRWVAHFRSSGTAEHSQLNQSDYSYYELRPQDGSLSAKLMQSGEVPLSLACESSGTYIAFKRDKDGKLLMLNAD